MMNSCHDLPQPSEGIAAMGGMDGMAGIGGIDGMGGIGGLEGIGLTGQRCAPLIKGTAPTA